MPRQKNRAKKKIIKASLGQILIEALIGLAIVSITLVALLSLSLRALKVQLLNKQWNQAGQLEQESLEAIRQIRDGNGKIKLEDDTEIDWAWNNEEYTIWESSTPTYFRLYFDQDPAKLYWVLEKVNESYVDPHDQIYKLAYDQSTNKFGYPGLGGFPTQAFSSPFYRQIKIIDRAGVTNSKEVSSTLSWKEAGAFHESKLVSIFSQW